MFNGIIRNLGQVVEIKKSNKILLKVACSALAQNLGEGDSVAVDGVCLTVIKTDGGQLWFELIPQTWKLTRFFSLKVNDSLNLEKPLALKDCIDGHLLMGHVDGVATVQSILNKKNLRQVEIKAPSQLKKFIALRGAIAVNGVSLTVSQSTAAAFKVSLTDYTAKNTNLGQLQKGARVNLEVDIISRYLDNLLKSYAR